MNFSPNQIVIRLTPALVETLPHYAEGMSYEDMRETFGISKSSIKGRCETLRRIFGVSSRNELTVEAVRLGFLTPIGESTGQIYCVTTAGGM